MVPPLDIGPLPHLFSPLNRILSFFPSTFASKLPIYKAGTAGVLGAERLRGLRGSGLAVWGEREEGTAAGVIFLKKKKKEYSLEGRTCKGPEAVMAMSPP